MKKLINKLKYLLYLIDGGSRIYYITKIDGQYKIYSKPVTSYEDMHRLVNNYGITQFTDKKSAQKKLKEMTKCK